MFNLTEAEWKIMEILWSKGSLTTMEIIKEMEELHGWAKSTVITVLNRMDNKGSIRYEMKNKSKIYTANIAKSEAKIEETRTFLDKFYEGSLGLMIKNFIREEALSAEEIEEIQKIINEGE